MSWAADAAGHPNPWDLKGTGCLFVGQYVGTRYQNYGVSRGYIDQCLGIGLGVMLIFEEQGNQFLGGYDEAVRMMQRMHQGWDQLGAPSDGSVIPAIALVDPTPSTVYGNEENLRWFARGVNDMCWTPSFTGYGSRYGLDIAGEVAPKMTRRWGVGPWGYGERGDGSLPAYVPADMIQHGNRGAPVDGCDYNTLFRDDMGQWGGPVTTPPTKRKRAEDMTIMWINYNGMNVYLVQAGVIVKQFQGKEGAYGIPQDAYDFDAHTQCGITGMDGGEWTRLLKRTGILEK